MHCEHFLANRCRSCTELALPYEDQLAAKEQHCRELLAAYPQLQWQPSFSGVRSGFRNKAKMVVSGSVYRPVLGIVDANGRGVDLRDCGLYPEPLQAVFPTLAEFITLASLAPYDIHRKRGELKFLLLTQADDGALMLRFVLRSEEPLERIQRHLPDLLARLPQVRVVSVNLQPEHKAVIEGEHEIPLTENDRLTIRVDDLPLQLRPQSFFQTNTEVAGALYRQARDWTDELQPATLWDLYCGVGGFALHCAAEGREVTGIELSAEAVASAEASRDALPDRPGFGDVQFVAADATQYVRDNRWAPELAIVNPPRRGIGEALSRQLEASTTRWVIYSSCNAESLARDLAWMPSLKPRRARLLDMFPQTRHYELILLMERESS